MTNLEKLKRLNIYIPPINKKELDNSCDYLITKNIKKLLKLVPKDEKYIILNYYDDAISYIAYRIIESFIAINMLGETEILLTNKPKFTKYCFKKSKTKPTIYKKKYGKHFTIDVLNPIYQVQKPSDNFKKIQQIDGSLMSEFSPKHIENIFTKFYYMELKKDLCDLTTKNFLNGYSLYFKDYIDNTTISFEESSVINNTIFVDVNNINDKEVDNILKNIKKNCYDNFYFIYYIQDITNIPPKFICFFELDYINRPSLNYSLIQSLDLKTFNQISKDYFMGNYNYLSNNQDFKITIQNIIKEMNK